MKRYLIILVLFASLSGFSQVDMAKNANAFSKGIECKYKEDVPGAIQYFEEALKYLPDDAASMFELSEQYVKAGRVEDGLNMIQKAAQIDPENKWYQMRLARFYRNLQEYDKYIEIYESLVEKYPGDINMISDLIEIYLTNENYEKALEKLDLLEKQAGVNELVSEERLEIYKKMGNTKQVVAELQKTIAQHPDNTRYYHMLAKIYMETNKEKEALKLYEQIKEIDPNDPYINVSLLEYYVKKGHVDKAFEELIDAINNKNLDFNTKANIYDYWFNTFQAEKNIDQQALRVGNAFVNAYPDHQLGYLILASYHMNREEYQACQQMSLKALQYDRSNYGAWQYLVLSEAPLLETDSLMKHAKEALQFYPTQPIFYWFAGVSHALAKQDEEAVAYFEKGRKFVTDKKLLVDFDSYLGDLYHSVGEEEKAFDAYERVLRTDPDNVLVLNNYAYYLALKNQDLDKALEMSTKAITQEPDNPTYLDTHAWVLYMKGDYKEAEKHMKKALKLLKEPDETYNKHYDAILNKLKP